MKPSGSSGARDFPDGYLPPAEKPPHDRDRFLPEPPRPLPEWVPPDDDAEDDPLGLGGVDTEMRIENLKEEIAEATDGEFIAGKSGDLPPALEEAFLEQVRDLEREGWQRPLDQLAAQSAAPLPPDELTDETLTAKLWELLHSLACRGFYVQHSDHLSGPRALHRALGKRACAKKRSSRAAAAMADGSTISSAATAPKTW